MFELYEKTAAACSKNITQTYSTSFSLGIKALSQELHEPIYGIYGMVRYADEIVDTFHDYNKSILLEKFKQDAFEAIEQKISLNPVLFAFQKVVNQYKIPPHLIEAFFESMEMDLHETSYERKVYERYIYGSAEVVGLMCLKVFVNGNDEMYARLEPGAKALGAAFQKVNFLRDMKSDFYEKGRTYFPGIDFINFKCEAKRQIEKEITADFSKAYDGIQQLPLSARYGVMLAYAYYNGLFAKIKRVPVNRIMEARIRISNARKALILLRVLIQRQLLFFRMGQDLTRISDL